jgi:hypothetical protein
MRCAVDAFTSKISNVAGDSKTGFNVWVIVSSPLPTSGDLHLKEIPADHQTLEALQWGRASVCDVAS